MSLMAIALSYALSITAVPDGLVMIYDEQWADSSIDSGSPLYIDMSSRLSFGPIFVDGSVVTEVVPVRVDLWDPTGVRYTVSAGLRFGGVELSIRHWCQHPSITWASYWAYHGVDRHPLYEGVQTEITLSLRGETHLPH